MADEAGGSSKDTGYREKSAFASFRKVTEGAENAETMTEKKEKAKDGGRREGEAGRGQLVMHVVCVSIPAPR